MTVKLIDTKSGNCVASGDILTDNFRSEDVFVILQDARLHADSFGNIRDIFGGYTRYHIDNLIAMYDYAETEKVPV